MIPTGLKQEKELKDKKPYVMSAEEQESYSFYIKRLNYARDQRNGTYKEFDDLTYEEDYELNKQAMNSYLRKKRNDDEVRINTGTTEKKIESVMNELLALNLQPEIHAFNQHDIEIEELGTDMEDVVKRTGAIEGDDDFWVEAIQELLTQRALFVEETYDERVTAKKDISKRGLRGKPAKYKTGKRSKQIAQKRVLDGRQVFLGDMTIPACFFDTQPYILKYDRVSYTEAETLFGEWEMFEHVKPGMPSSDQYNLNFKYRFGSLAKDEVEIVEYLSLKDNERQIILNGVMMLEPGEPLSEVREGYRIRMYVLKPMGRAFAYGKPLTASAKTLQALDNETIRILIRKFRQAIEPPLGVPGGKVFGKDIWSPGAITQGLKKDDVAVLIDHQGVTVSEMQMYKLITSKIDEFVGRSDLSAGMVSQKLTAAQTIESQKQAAKMLGLSILTLMRAKRDLTLHRIYTLLESYLDPVEHRLDPLQQKLLPIYELFTIPDGRTEEDKNVTKIVKFMDRDLTEAEEEALLDFEDEEQEKGNPIRIKTINVNKLREIPIQWHITVSQTEREGSALNKVMFQDKIRQAVELSQIAGRPLNGDKIIEDFEQTWRAKDLFQKAPPPALGQPALSGQRPAGQSEIGADLTGGVATAATAKPGAAQLVGATP